MITSQELVEVLARKMYQTDWWGYGRAASWYECSKEVKQFWEQKAKVAIEFMDEVRGAPKRKIRHKNRNQYPNRQPPRVTYPKRGTIIQDLDEPPW